jgi:hypothetical protein
MHGNGVFKMKKQLLVIATLTLVNLPMHAKDKAHYDYQDGVLQSFRTEDTGQQCSTTSDTNGTVDATTDDSATINTSTTSSTSCRDTQRALYTLKVADNTFVLTPSTTGKGAALGMATLGWSQVFAKNSVLAYQLPGTHVQIRSDGKHYFIRINDRESMYSLVGAQ